MIGLVARHTPALTAEEPKRHSYRTAAGEYDPLRTVCATTARLFSAWYILPASPGLVNKGMRLRRAGNI